MATVIFVGGASASGKSTFVDELVNNLENSIKYRRVQCYFDIATLLKIDEDKIFNEISSEEVDNWFVEKCKNSEFLVSDVHYAIQVERSISNNNSLDIYQEYLPTISDNLLKKLFEANINVIAIHISCSPFICYQRAAERFKKNEREMRAISLEDAELENKAEKREWIRILLNSNVYGMELSSEKLDKKELVENLIDFLIKNDFIKYGYNLSRKRKI